MKITGKQEGSVLDIGQFKKEVDKLPNNANAADRKIAAAAFAAICLVIKERMQNMANSADSIRMKDDTLIESQFVSDYSEFVLRMIFYAIIALLEKARTVSDLLNARAYAYQGCNCVIAAMRILPYCYVLSETRLMESTFILQLGLRNSKKEEALLCPEYSNTLSLPNECWKILVLIQ